MKSFLISHVADTQQKKGILLTKLLPLIGYFGLHSLMRKVHFIENSDPELWATGQAGDLFAHAPFLKRLGFGRYPEKRIVSSLFDFQFSTYCISTTSLFETNQAASVPMPLPSLLPNSSFSVSSANVMGQPRKLRFLAVFEGPWRRDPWN